MGKTWEWQIPIDESWAIKRDNAELAFGDMKRLYPESIKSASQEFLNKIADESVKLTFSIDRSKFEENFPDGKTLRNKPNGYDTLRIKVLEVDDILVGIAISHNNSHFLISLDSYRGSLRLSDGPYGFEDGQDAWNELVASWNEWRYAARRYDSERAQKAKSKIYDNTRKYYKYKYGDDAEKETIYGY